MRAVVIADDLTGANDTGIRFAMRGIPAVVRLKADEPALICPGAVVFDTDSRSDDQETAYRKVRELCENLLPFEPELVYKKIDSTLRGNIGAEIDAVYDVLRPDVVVIAPAFPDNGRSVKDGILYVDDLPLHLTETARDVKTPVSDSRLTSWLGSQTKNRVGLIGLGTIESGSRAVADGIRSLVERGVPYLVFDSVAGEHLTRIAEAVNLTGLRAVWCGSAGLAGALLHDHPVRPLSRGIADIGGSNRILLVTGSVSERTRIQVERIVQDPNVEGIELRGSWLLQPSECGRELSLAHGKALSAFREGKHVALYLSARPDEMKRTGRIGSEMNLDPRAVSARLNAGLATLAAGLIRHQEIRRLIMVGGDTARSIFLMLGIDELELIDEVDSGVPLVRTKGGHPIHAMTKSGGFGDDRILQRMLQYFWEKVHQ
jgi:uncharacterized protein YgbK (DUF1537 family)